MSFARFNGAVCENLRSLIAIHAFMRVGQNDKAEKLALKFAQENECTTYSGFLKVVKAEMLDYTIKGRDVEVWSAYLSEDMELKDLRFYIYINFQHQPKPAGFEI